MLRIQKRFRILKNWKIRLVKSKRYAAQVTVGKRRATIYDYKGRRPPDFLLHEILHCALRALWTMDKRSSKEIRLAEELLIRDICSFIGDHRARKHPVHATSKR